MADPDAARLAEIHERASLGCFLDPISTAWLLSRLEAAERRNQELTEALERIAAFKPESDHWREHNLERLELACTIARNRLTEANEPDGECHGRCAAEYANFGCPTCRAEANEPPSRRGSSSDAGLGAIRKDALYGGSLASGTLTEPQADQAEAGGASGARVEESEPSGDSADVSTGDTSPGALARTLRKAREHQGYTLRDVEAETSVHNARLSQIERGLIRKPTLDALIPLAAFYHLDLALLVEMAGYTPAVVEAVRTA